MRDREDVFFGCLSVFVFAGFTIFTVLFLGSAFQELNKKYNNNPIVTYEVRIVSQAGHEEIYEMNSRFEPEVRYYGIPDVHGSENNITFPEGWLATVKKKNVEN